MTIRSIFRAALALGVLATWHPVSATATCPPAGDCSVPGGGSTSFDCLVEYDGVTPNDPPSLPKRVKCTDGDPTCDTDGLANGSCRFRVSACINNPDSRFPSCPPSVSPITGFTIANK